MVPRPIRGTERLLLFLFFTALGLMQGVRHDEWTGAREQSGCGCANTLVDLCNSRAGSLWPLLGARRKMAGQVWKSHRMENGHEESQAPVVFSPGGLLSFMQSSRQPPQGKDDGRWRVYFELWAFYCCKLLLFGGRPPSFTDPPAAVEVGGGVHVGA